MCKPYYMIVGGLKHELQARANKGEKLPIKSAKTILKF